jgi:two-component system, OmpR family, response regulator ChvI
VPSPISHLSPLCRGPICPIRAHPLQYNPHMSGSIAVVDDEENIRETLAFALGREGYAVETYGDGAEAWEAFLRGLPDLVILDIIMPRMDGLELCRRIREVSATVPIIFLTSRDDELDRVLGLEIGADDYLCKPFSMRELVARVKVLFRRLSLAGAASRTGDNLRAGDLVLDLERYTVEWKAAKGALTVTEFMMLRALVRHAGEVRTRAQLRADGYPHDSWASDRTVDSHVRRLRRKFESVDPAFDRIETVYGVGYRFREASA